jgi:SEC-C motif domain protein
MAAIFCSPHEAHFTMQTMTPGPACPCGGAAYATCCAPFIAGEALPATAEQLMRSRYTAYTLGNEAYLRATWHPSTCPSDAIVDESGTEKTKWLGLEIKSAFRLRQRNDPRDEQPEDRGDADSVEFVARYKLGGRAHRLHEVSRFVREDAPGGKRWFYLDGSFPERRARK